MSDRSRDRATRGARPALEALEGRALLSSGARSPTNPEPITQPTPQQLGAAYRDALALQESTDQAIQADHHLLYDAYGHLAATANPSNPRDRRILAKGAAIVARQERGLVVARGVEQLNAVTEKMYIPQRLFTTLPDLVKQDQSVADDIVRSARRSTEAAVRELDALAGRT